MAWWDTLFGGKVSPPGLGEEYRVAFILYSEDGKREAKVLEFRRGQIFMLESDQAEDGRRVERHTGSLVGPFASPAEVERFITATAWFKGEELS